MLLVGADLDYCDVEWFALETNRDHSVISETASKYCFSNSFVDYDGYSISSEGFLHVHFSLVKSLTSRISLCRCVYLTLFGKSYTYMKVISQFVLL